MELLFNLKQNSSFLNIYFINKKLPTLLICKHTNFNRTKDIHKDVSALGTISKCWRWNCVLRQSYTSGIENVKLLYCSGQQSSVPQRWFFSFCKMCLSTHSVCQCSGWTDHRALRCVWKRYSTNLTGLHLFCQEECTKIVAICCERLVGWSCLKSNSNDQGNL